MTAVTFKASLRRAGRPMVLKRRAGTSITDVRSCTVYGKDTAFTPEQIIGTVVSGDRRIRIAKLDIPADWPGPVPSGTQASQWPSTIRAGDILDGSTVKLPRPLYEATELAGYEIHVTGSGQ